MGISFTKRIQNNRQIIQAIARVTFTEILRDKVLYNIFLFALLLFGVSFAASQLTFITPQRVVLDFGFSAINISCALIAILNGSSMLAREYERRTVYVALARPINRHQFVVGKFLGLLGIVTINWLMLSILETALYFYLGGAWGLTYAIGLLMLLLQSFVLASLALFFSSFVTTSLSVVILFGLYLIGNNISSMQTLFSKMEEGVLLSLLQGISYLLPNFEHFNLGFKITYQLPVGLAFGWMGLAYGLVLIFLSLGGAGFFLQGREN